jgi:16S rRNA (cytidine1402-2'-O)-methyltransferase
MPATLYVVPNLLGLVPPESVLPLRTIATARGLTSWVVETPKAARAFLKMLGVARPISELAIVPLPDGRGARDMAAVLSMLNGGQDVGLLSDAGCPGVADAGATLVAAAHERGLRVVPLVGPSAILLALMASGMNGQQFCFHGYLPVKPDARAQALRQLEAASRAGRRAELFIETPYRNAALLRSIAEALAPLTQVCVAADLTLETESVERRTAGEWRKVDPARYDKRPAMFVLQA